MQNVHASPRYERAIAAVADLVSRLRMQFVFAGNVARSAWLGSRVEHGSVDLLVLMSPEQKNQVAMMANNRGFRVDRAEIEQSEELDLIPINFVDAEGEVRVHILVASNALYGRMVAAGVPVMLAHGQGEVALRVVTSEDLALMLSLSEDEESRLGAETLMRLPDFDRSAYNSRLVSIGLSQMVIAE